MQKQKRSNYKICNEIYGTCEKYGKKTEEKFVFNFNEIHTKKEKLY
jgi:hypothetical protein